MKTRPFTLWLAILTLPIGPVAQAAPDQQAGDVPITNRGAERANYGTSGIVSPPSRELVTQKLQLVKMLLVKSPALERATRSDAETTKQLVTTANTYYTNANEELNAGKLSHANELLDEALRLIGDVSRMAPDPRQVEDEQRTRYTKLLEGVRSLQHAYQDLRHRLAPKDSASPSTMADLERVRKQVDQAQTYAADSHYREAGDLLKTAHATIVAALNKLPASTNAPFEVKFDTAAEEFDYEIARYHSYEELAPIAYTELKPGEESVNLSERYVRESRTTLDLAKQQAASGDYSSAINTLQNAIKQLQAALQAVGVIVTE